MTINGTALSLASKASIKQNRPDTIKYHDRFTWYFINENDAAIMRIKEISSSRLFTFAITSVCMG